ncbi:MAG: S1 RNA-binding domain-containing protein [Deltaproteobacteria bacterium]|nr:S1 RNA-binding domain-containing protein [Deltaproteobacteria bacterium]MBW2209520.1 S1 RNA-binding domain-containing protein [Deltaproteobacteria bacterium]MBW2214344.1 S1 RNA-binding domain-containing protein [Deltaproteobacteria bacterium]MBW2551487.1 S1 RNA-binding domain-containing protein [Deltaproteobacteria bacterium]MBW2627160.1 S1 RNA-binding domain-containing protein [Deltaproteobacteria bacterium]
MTAGSVGEAETVSGDVAAAEAQADTEAGDAAPDVSTESSAGDVEAEGAGKKKRRRRRKKKGAQAGASDAPPDAKSTQHHAPFLHLFSGGVTRKHAFSVGEEIAGRVERVEHGTILVDLFGKATAVVNVDEPREIPHIVREAEGQAAEAAASDVVESEAPAEPAVPEARAPMHTPVVPSPAAILTPVIEAPTPEMAKLVQGDTSAWEFSPTEVTDVPDEEIGEADTVVGAQAFDPTSTAEAQLAVTEPPTIEAVAATEAATAAEAATETGAASETETGALAAEDPAEADLTVLDPLPELEVPQVGAIFRGRIGAVAESGHIAIVNRVIDKGAVRKALRAARDLHHRVEGVVYGYNRGGFDVLVGGVRAFCPASAMSLTHIDDPNALVGQRCEFSLPQDKGGKKSIIVSRRNILEKESRKKARERMAALEVGTKLEGKVLEVRDYGVLVDLGDGLDGLVHMSEVSWSRGVRPQDAAKVGDEVNVEVLKVQQASRKDRFGRVSLSMRACQPDPLEAAKDTIRPGMPIKGKVVRTTDFGAFIQLQDDIEGLLHISELGGSRELTHAKQAVSEGDEIHVVIERVDRQQRRISLSRLTEADAAAIEAGEVEVGKAPRSLKQGTMVPVIVKRVDHTGVQVQVAGMLGKRGRGFIPSRELQDLRDDKRKGVSQGDTIEVKVIGTERDGTLRCSIRARLLDDERKAVREYRKESAKQGLGTFGDLLKAKLGGGSD